MKSSSKVEGEAVTAGVDNAEERQTSSSKRDDDVVMEKTKVCSI